MNEGGFLMNKDKLHDKETKYAGAGYAKTDNRIPKSVRDTFFSNGERSKTKRK